MISKKALCMSNNVIPKITQLSNQELKARAMGLSFLSLGIPFETAKQCALIAVEEILSELKYHSDAQPIFWSQVKTEIEKL